jgi:hypothetical protein
MNKVKLQLDELQVESFAVHPDAPAPGTVLGLQDVYSTRAECSQAPTVCLPCLSDPPSNCGEQTCYETCYETCASCYVSCAQTACADAKTCSPTRCMVMVGPA